jgi:5,10-methylenetetrahydromethanopterin reductase
MKDVYVAMALCAVNTERIKLGPGVTNPITRDITLTACSISAIQEVSNGRAILGIGAGGSAVEGIGLKAARVQVMEEQIVLLRRLFAGETVEIRGARVQLRVSQGQVPIYVSATQPKMLALAGRVADGVILMGSSTPHLVKQQIDTILAAAREAGRKREEIVIDLWQTISVSDDRQQALNDVKAWVASQSKWWFSRATDTPAEVAAAVHGSEVQQTAQAYEYLDHLSLHAEHKDSVSDDLADLMAIAGDAEYCAAKLRAVASLGVDHMTLALLSGGRMRRLQQLAEVVQAVGR